MRATSRTSWCSAWRGRRRSGRSCRGWPGRATTCREARAWTTSCTWRASRHCWREAGRARRAAVAPAASGTELARAADVRRDPRPREGAMNFQVNREADVVAIDVEGQLIVGNRQELKQKVLQELEDGARKFLIDFARTGYIDSSGLGVLVSLSKKIREQGGELRLASLNDDLRTLFELTKLDTLF